MTLQNSTKKKKKTPNGGGGRGRRRGAPTMTHRLNCHPVAEAKRLHTETCLDPTALQEVRRALHVPVANANPHAVYQNIKQVMEPKCHGKNELCWLDAMPPPQKQKLMRRYYAPKQPREWAKNPREWLSNYDIMNVLKQYEERYPAFKILGPSPIDFDKRLPEEGNHCVEDDLCGLELAAWKKKGKTKIAMVFNLSPHDEDGSHWVTLFVDLDDRILFYFDSAAETRPKEIGVLVKRLQDQARHSLAMTLQYHENRLDHQYGGTECGMYSLYFIITMLTSHSDLVSHPLSLGDKLQLFKHRRIPDKYVEQFRSVYFNKGDAPHVGGAPTAAAPTDDEPKPGFFRRKFDKVKHALFDNSQKESPPPRPPDEPTVTLAHTTHPLLRWLQKGKSAVADNSEKYPPQNKVTVRHPAQSWATSMQHVDAWLADVLLNHASATIPDKDPSLFEKQLSGKELYNLLSGKP